MKNLLAWVFSIYSYYQIVSVSRKPIVSFEATVLQIHFISLDCKVRSWNLFCFQSALSPNDHWHCCTDPEELNGADVSLSGKVLVTMLRQEIARFNDMIREEKLSNTKTIDILRSLEEARTEIQGLLSEVEKHLEENPENEEDLFPGKVTLKAQSEARKEDNDQP